VTALTLRIVAERIENGEGGPQKDQSISAL
jgi:hypothetical protein